VAGFAWAILAGMPALLYRIRVEEAALETWFPGEYPQYQRTSYRLVPGLW
jgi:protein-S-isoprenylcysteine O-methyltransferase Ste14